MGNVSVRTLVLYLVFNKLKKVKTKPVFFLLTAGIEEPLTLRITM